MKKYKIFPILIISIIFIWSCNEQDNSDKNKKEVIKIGAVLTLTGENAYYGETAKKIMDLMIEEYNKKDSLIDYKIIYEDCQGIPVQAATSIKKLISVDKVSIVLGDIMSPTTMAMTSIANNEKVVIIAISASAPAITDAGPYIYRVWPSDLYEGVAFAKWCIKNDFKKIGVIHLRNDYGVGLNDAFGNKLIELGGEITQSEGFEYGKKDNRNIILNILKKQNDAIYIIGDKNTSQIIKQIRELNKEITILGTSSSESEELANLPIKISEGFIYAKMNDYDADNPSEKQQGFINLYKERYGSIPDFITIHAADALLVAFDVIENCSNPDNYNSYIDSVKKFSGFTGELLFDEYGDVIDKPLVIKEVRNGKFEIKENF